MSEIRSWISIHAPPRGATEYSILPVSVYEKFQFTPLREGRHGLIVHSLFQNGFQFTPLREGRRSRAAAPFLPEVISIHAPPRGATRSPAVSTVLFKISIHAPPRGATARVQARSALRAYFNSRPSARGDQPSIIHSAWMANFNSRPSARGDISEDAPKEAVTFQFTPLREGRQFNKIFKQIADLFQFTPLREGRREKLRGLRRAEISIHAPPRGATPRCPSNRGRCRQISIHAPPRGATRRPVHPLVRGYFNSRPSARGDSASLCSQCHPIFQFTPLREGRQGVF